ncbi:PREDICTED: uncharacterized protein LOC107071265 [Polistes dominula]|uniref:Uncharacterized protein LOC107071265 n=1 Tax=Polistes dominula TaxID=743375 RepID=A0ABM1IZF0_POLDO|nr:PREDICTED: uncharacterized protein LOC107071265 [Polistes dominula]
MINCKDIDKSSNIVETLTASSILRKNNERYSTDKNMFKEKEVHRRAHERAQAYLEEKQILKLFNFLIGHLLVEEPPDPIQYLEKLLKECILYRSGMKKPPLLFQTRHIRSIFRSLGPDDCNTISLDKYTTGMTILGICDYEPNPFECMPGHVDWHTFKKEARRCLDKALDDMIGKERNDLS